MSDYPFKNRAPHQLDEFERKALESLRTNPDQRIEDASGSLLSESVRLVAPVVIGIGLRQLPQRPSGKPEEGLEGG